VRPTRGHDATHNGDVAWRKVHTHRPSSWCDQGAFYPVLKAGKVSSGRRYTTNPTRPEPVHHRGHYPCILIRFYNHLQRCDQIKKRRRNGRGPLCFPDGLRSCVLRAVHPRSPMDTGSSCQRRWVVQSADLFCMLWGMGYAGRTTRCMRGYPCEPFVRHHISGQLLLSSSW
jgi:hypothetical protein